MENYHPHYNTDYHWHILVANALYMLMVLMLSILPVLFVIIVGTFILCVALIMIFFVITRKGG